MVKSNQSMHRRSYGHEQGPLFNETERVLIFLYALNTGPTTRAKIGEMV